MAATAPEAYATTVGIRMMIGWMRKASITSSTSLLVILIPRYSGVLPDIRPTMKTVITMYMIIYINPTPFPPGVAWMSIPMKAERMTRGCMAERLALTEPVVTAVVTTVQNADMKPPILVSIPGPRGVVCMNAITRSMAKSP